MSQDLKKGLKQSTALCNKIIAQVTKIGMSFEAVVQQGIKAVIRHGDKYHDVDPAKRFVIAVSTSVPGYATNQLIAFIERMSPIKFEYDDTKTKVVGVSESKDDKGNLKKAYQTDEILDKAPFIMEKPVRNQNDRKIEPFSLGLYKNRLKSLEDQLNKAGEADGRGIVGPDGKTLHKGDPNYDAAYASLYNAIHQHRMMADNIFAIVSSGIPAAALDEKLPQDTTVSQLIKGRTAAAPVTTQHKAANAKGETVIKQKPKAAGRTAKAA